MPAKGNPLSRDLRRGSFLVLVGYGGGQILRLGGNLVLWRLLPAEAFGLMALVNTFLQGIAMFSDVGIGPSIIQNQRGDDPDYLNTAWTIQVTRGLLMFLVGLVGAPVVADFYNAPTLAKLIPFCAVTAAFAGFNSTRLITEKKKVALARLVLLDLSTQTLSTVTMIAWAAATHNVWALASGSIAGSLAKLAMSHSLLPGIRNRLRWHAPSAKVLLRFGRWIFLSTLLGFAAMQSDRLIFGKLVSLKDLGVYSVAATWATIPNSIMSQVASAVMFPLVSRVKNQGGDVGAAYRQTRLTWLILAGFMVTCLACGGPTLIQFLYDKRAESAGWIIQILAVSAWFCSLELPNRMTLLAQGRPKWMAAGSALKVAGMAVMIPIGFAHFGFPGAVAGLAATDVLTYLTSVVGLARIGIVGVAVDGVLSCAVLIATAIGLAASAALRREIEPLELAQRLSAFLEGFGILLVVSAGWGVAFLLARRFRRAKAQVPG